MRVAIGEANDWMCMQPDNIMYELWQLDFDWTAQSVAEEEDRWALDDD